MATPARSRPGRRAAARRAARGLQDQIASRRAAGRRRNAAAASRLIDGLPKVTCSVRIAQVEGRSVVTLEGVSDNERRLYADAFQAAAGLQCGFCTPGLVLRIKYLTDQGSHLVARRDRPGARRASVPLHRLCEDHRRGGADPGGQAAAAPCRRSIEDGGVGAAAAALPGRRTGAGRAAFCRRHRRSRHALRRRRAVAARARPGRRASTPPRRWRFPASPRWRPPRMCRAIAGSARFIGTGPASSPKARRCVMSATWWRPWPPRARASRARPRSWSRSNMRYCRRCSTPPESIKPGAPQVNPRHAQCPVGHALCAGRRRGGARCLGACGHRHVEDATHRASVP